MAVIDRPLKTGNYSNTSRLVKSKGANLDELAVALKPRLRSYSLCRLHLSLPPTIGPAPGAVAYVHVGSAANTIISDITKQLKKGQKGHPIPNCSLDPLDPSSASP